MTSASASPARPLLLLVAAVAAVFACIPLAAHAGAITTVNRAPMMSSVCTGSYIGRLTDIDTAYLPGDYDVPGRYCIQSTHVNVADCDTGSDRTNTYTYDLYSSASITSNGGSTSRNCKGIINMRQEPATVAAAYLGLPAGVKDLASLGKAGRLAATGTITHTDYSTIVYLAPSASLTGGTTVLSGNPAQLTWSSNLASPVSPYGSCSGMNFSASGTSGSAVVYPAQTTTYGVSCSLTSGNGSATSYQTVNVCSGSYGQSCSATSAANACGQTNTSYGSIQCDGSCSVGTPGAPANPAGYGQSCSATSAANACGQTNTSYGSIQCNGSCSVGTPGAPANPAGYGNICTSGANSCGATNSGSIQCNGSCSASTPANPAGYGNICTSAANACGQTSTGTIMCNGSCSAATPSNGSCPSPTASLTPSSVAIPVGGNATLTWTSVNAFSCTGTNFSTAGATHGSVSVSPTANTTYALVCSSSAGATTPVQSAVVTVNYPDLMACTVSHNCATAVTNSSGGSPASTDALTLSAPISNTGLATASNFPNFFMITDASGTVVRSVTPTPSNISSLAANTNATITGTTAALPGGSYHLQACANSNSAWGGSVPESNGSNNCGDATPFTVTQTLLPDLSAGATTVTPSSPGVGQSITLSSSVSNAGAGAASNFPNMFQIATDPDFTNTVATVNANTVSSLGAASCTP